LALAGLTVVAAALRAFLADQSLLGDELLTYAVVHRSTPGQVIHALNNSIESTPPLYYLLGWATGRLGGDPALIRMPSLIAGTVTVPAIGLLGALLWSRTCGLVAAAIVTLSPFALFYSVEARAYALVTLLVTASTALLILALRRGPWWWVAFALAAAAAMYTHYTAAFPLLALAVWTLVGHPQKRRPLLLSMGAVALAFLAWVPWLEGRALGLIAAFYPLTPANIAKAPISAVFGSPQEALSAIPGRFALALAGAGVVVAVTAVVASHRREAQAAAAVSTAPASGVPGALWLILALAVSTPVGLLLYGLVGDDLYNPRNLSASVPGLVLLISAAVTSHRGRTWASLLVIAAGAVGAARSLEPRYRRPPVNEAADFINHRLRPGDLVIDTPALPVGYGLNRELTIYLDPGARTFVVTGVPAPGDRALGPLAGSRAWRRIVGRRRAFVVAPVVATRPDVRMAPADSGARLIARRQFRGLQTISVAEYAPGR